MEDGRQQAGVGAFAFGGGPWFGVLLFGEWLVTRMALPLVSQGVRTLRRPVAWPGPELAAE